MANEPVNCKIEHHAILFAYLAKRAIEICGEEGKEALGGSVLLAQRPDHRPGEPGTGIHLYRASDPGTGGVHDQHPPGSAAPAGLVSGL